MRTNIISISILLLLRAYNILLRNYSCASKYILLVYTFHYIIHITHSSRFRYCYLIISVSEVIIKGFSLSVLSFALS